MTQFDLGAGYRPGGELYQVTRIHLGHVNAPRAQMSADLCDFAARIEINQVNRKSNEEHVHAVAARFSELEQESLAVTKLSFKHQAPESAEKIVGQFNLPGYDTPGAFVQQAFLLFQVNPVEYVLTLCDYLNSIVWSPRLISET